MSVGVLNPRQRLPSVTSKRESVFSSGRGGSGNIRRVTAPKESEKTLEHLDYPTRDRQGTSNADRFISSGRGGSGNIQPSSDLDSHPLTAAILSEHNALETQYEERVRKVHAESSVARSSGRGGSGNISGQRRAHSNEPSLIKSFLIKGRAKGPRRPGSSESAAARDKQVADSDTIRSKRRRDTLFSTYTTNSSSRSSERSSSNIELSSSSMISIQSMDSLPSDDMQLSAKKRQNRWHRLPKLNIPNALNHLASPVSSKSSRRSDISMLSSGVHSMPVVSEDQEFQ